MLDYAVKFWYGLTATALQLARAYAAIANDGIILPVSWVKVAQAPKGVSVNSRPSIDPTRYVTCGNYQRRYWKAC